MPAFISRYKIIQKIGEGSFSEVLKCEERMSKEQFAAKILKKLFHSTTDVLYCAEIIAMQKLSRHPNILYMHEYFFEKSSGKLIFIFELMDMSLYEFMKTKTRCIPESKVKTYLYQILKGLDYLHRHGLFHRDIKPENILVKFKQPNNHGEVVKIADLGSIRGIFSKPPYTEYISTRWYRSPECLLTIGHYGAKMDIWATGCVYYEMLTMKPLFPGTNEIDQLDKIHSILGTPTSRTMSKLRSRSKNYTNFTKQIGVGLGALTSGFSDDAQILLKIMLQYDPDIRSNAKRLLQHRYFERMREEDRTRRFAKIFVTREYGDTARNNSFEPVKIKRYPQQFYSNSCAKFEQEDCKKSLVSHTMLSLSKKGCLQKGKRKGTAATCSNPSTANSFRKRIAPKQITQQQKSKSLRNTTSNLIKKIYTERNKGRLLSSSFVMPNVFSVKERPRHKF